MAMAREARPDAVKYGPTTDRPSLITLVDEKIPLYVSAYEIVF